MSSGSLDVLQRTVQAFVDERDWNQFHDSKNLAMALASEVGELCAVLRWASSSSIANLEADQEVRQKLVDEIGDVGILLLAMCNRLGLKLEEIVFAKIEKNTQRYPSEKSRGKAERP
jgi:dCTP diphosphatase